MKKSIRDQMGARKQRLASRLDKFNYPDDLEQPMMRASNVQYELSGRAVGTAYGGIGLLHKLVQTIGLAEEIDQRLVLFKFHLPYHESDHVLNLAYNALCDGRCLEDLEQRRQDEAYLNVLGAERIPDPTTAGDFCRRFEPYHLRQLQAAFDAARKKVWARQPAEFFAEARIDADGTLVATRGECKAGMDCSYQGVWGYHPLLVSLANTGEVLRLINRPGNRPSHEGAAQQFDECLALCREAGFQRFLLRGDTDFSQLSQVDRWHAQPDVRFIFGLDVTALQHIAADDLPKEAWKPLKRPAKYRVKTKRRGRRERVKQRIVEERGYKDIRLVDEWVAERLYRPSRCQHTYRLVIVRKNLQVHKSIDPRQPRQRRLFDDYRYFIYITNDRERSPAEIVFLANDRCQQENLVSQLKSGVRSLTAPVDHLLSNWAYMLMTSLAWNLKAWLALWLSAEQGCPSQREQQQAQKQQLLGCEFRTFVNRFIRLPAHVVKTGRRIIVRLLAWNSWQPVFFRLVDQLMRPRGFCPLRC